MRPGASAVAGVRDASMAIPHSPRCRWTSSRSGDRGADGLAENRKKGPGSEGRGGGCQAERPTRTEAVAMQVRMKRGMGGPPAEKEATGHARRPSRGHYAENTAPVRRRQEIIRALSQRRSVGAMGSPARSLRGDELVKMRLRPQVEGASVDRRGCHAAVGEFVRGENVVRLGGGEDRRLALLVGAVDLPVGDDR